MEEGDITYTHTRTIFDPLSSLTKERLTSKKEGGLKLMRHLTQIGNHTKSLWSERTSQATFYACIMFGKDRYISVFPRIAFFQKVSVLDCLLQIEV